jgi:hypothetical protein
MSHKTLFALALIAALSVLAQRGVAQETPSLSGPIQNGIKHQPTQNELKALGNTDVSPNDAREIDRLYDELMQSGGKGGTHHPGVARMR